MASAKIEDDADDGPALPPGMPFYMTPDGHGRMVAELRHLLREERPRVVETVSWAAGNGDRSENGDYLYGKKRLGRSTGGCGFSPSGWNARRWSTRRSRPSAIGCSSAQR